MKALREASKYLKNKIDESEEDKEKRRQRQSHPSSSAPITYLTPQAFIMRVEKNAVKKFIESDKVIVFDDEKDSIRMTQLIDSLIEWDDFKDRPAFLDSLR